MLGREDDPFEAGVLEGADPLTRVEGDRVEHGRVFAACPHSALVNVFGPK